jgi:hypothetical protein
MKSGVLSNFYFQWYSLNLFKGHLYTSTITGNSRVFFKNSNIVLHYSFFPHKIKMKILKQDSKDNFESKN